MNILIVEDNTQKQDEIIKLIDERYNHLIGITCVESLEDAQGEIKYNNYDLYVLDFSIKSQNHSASIKYGIEAYNIICDKEGGVDKILGYSNFDNLMLENPEIAKSIEFINYTQKKDWNDIFLRFLEQYIQNNSIALRTDYDVAIVTALQEEFKYMKKASNTTWFQNYNTDELFGFYTTRMKNVHGDSIIVVAYTVHEMGMSYASAIATKMVVKFQPKYIVMTGICAGFEKKTNKGDIIVPQYVFNYQSGDIREGNDFGPLYKLKEIDDDLKKIIKQIQDNYKKDYIQNIQEEWLDKYDIGKTPGREQEIHIGKSFGTGSAVVKDGAIIQYIQEQYVKDLIGLDMEAYSVMIAAEFSEGKTIPLIVKSVQDFANKEKDEEYRKFACFSSARYFFKMCEDRLIAEMNK